jgi:hypothetical protein
LFPSPIGKLLAFALVALAVLVALSLLWAFFIAVPYDRALVADTGPLTSATIVLGKDADECVRKAFEATYLEPLEDHDICVTVRQGSKCVVPGFVAGSTLHYGMLLVVSLIAATPGLTSRRRLMLIPLAVVIMFVLQMVTVLIFAKVALSGANPSRNPLVTLFITLGTGLFPALVWGALSLKYWFPRPQKAGPAR